MVYDLIAKIWPESDSVYDLTAIDNDSQIILHLTGGLLVGYNSPKGLMFAGSVGTGFSEKLLKDMYDRMQRILRSSCPFVNLPEKRRGRWGQGITPAIMKRCTWVEPVLVAQIKFTEWTGDDQLRQPVFLGLRTDKRAAAVMREIS